MDEETFEQLPLPRATVEDALPFMQPSSSVQVLFVGDRASGVDLPASVVLEVTETEPGVKGDTVSNVTKPATSRRAASSRCRCSSTSATRSRSTRARSATSPEPDRRRSSSRAEIGGRFARAIRVDAAQANKPAGGAELGHGRSATLAHERLPGERHTGRGEPHPLELVGSPGRGAARGGGSDRGHPRRRRWHQASRRRDHGACDVGERRVDPPTITATWSGRGRSCRDELAHWASARFLRSTVQRHSVAAASRFPTAAARPHRLDRRRRCC